MILNRSEFSALLRKVAHVAPTRTPKPILGCVLISATGNRLDLRTTDGELSAEAYGLGVDAPKPFIAAAPAERLRAIIDADDSADVRLDAADGWLTVATDTGKYRIPTMPDADFPPSAFAGTRSIAVNAVTLSAMLRVEPFTSDETSRYAISGVGVIADSRGLALVATDGRALAVVHLGKWEEASRQWIVPVSAILAAKRSGCSDETWFNGGDGFGILLDDAGVQIHTTLVDGAFPPWRDVIPAPADVGFQANAEALLSALRRAKLLTSEESRGVRIEKSGDGVRLTSRSPETGSAVIELAADHGGMQPFAAFGVNPDYLARAVTACRSEVVRIETTSPKKAIRVVPVGANDFEAVVMPINLPEEG